MTKLKMGMLLAAVLCTLLAGCGQKGDLYFPDRDTPRKTG